MKSTIKKSTYKAIYRLLDHVSPLHSDCGELCDAACCTPVEELSTENEEDFQLGIYLLPGEDKIFTKKEDWLIWTKEDAGDYEFPDSWHRSVYFIRCTTPPVCPRKQRPLQCRFYPLAPHITQDNQLQLIYFPEETPYVCPLIHQKKALNKDFIKASFTVWTHLIRDPLIFDLVRDDSRRHEEENAAILPVYP